MPFVQVHVSRGHDAAQSAAIANAVHEALVAVVDIPSADRFQVVTRHADGEMVWDRGYLGVARSDRAVFVHVTLAAGRSDDKKRALYAAIAAGVARDAGVRPEDVLIVLTEVGRIDWSFGNGIAQYVPGPAPATG